MPIAASSGYASVPIDENAPGRCSHAASTARPESSAVANRRQHAGIVGAPSGGVPNREGEHARRACQGEQPDDDGRSVRRDRPRQVAAGNAAAADAEGDRQREARRGDDGRGGQFAHERGLGKRHQPARDRRDDQGDGGVAAEAELAPSATRRRQAEPPSAVSASACGTPVTATASPESTKISASEL